MLKKIAKKTLPEIAATKKALFDKLDSIQADVGSIRRSKLDLRLDRLRAALKKVEPYQPVYGIPDLVADAQRASRDRCDQILQSLDNDVASLRMLDVGSSLGYVSFYFADRGAKVEGWEFNPDNVEVSRLAQDINGINRAEFKLKEFDAESVKQMHATDFDVAVMLNVAHHIIYHKGLEYVKDLMKALTDRVPIVVVELARKGEDKTLFWDASQPEDALDIFEKCDVHIELLDEFPNHLSAKTRPLYKITRKHVKVNGRPYAVGRTISFQAYTKSPMRSRGVTRRYYTGPAAFIKEYILEPEVNNPHKTQIINELATVLKLDLGGKRFLTPKLLDYELGQKGAKLVYEKIDGYMLASKQDTARELSVEKIAAQVADSLAEIEGAGLYHNDIRSWNVLLSRKRAYLIDFGLADARPAENNAVAFFWMLHAAITGEREGAGEGKEGLPPRRVFRDYPKLAAAYDMVAKGETSFVKLAKALEQS